MPPTDDPPAADPIAVTIVIDEAYLAAAPGSDPDAALATLVATLTALGLSQGQTLPTLGLITGRIAPQQMAALAQVAGVDTVSPQTTYHLGPPERP